VNSGPLSARTGRPRVQNGQGSSASTSSCDSRRATRDTKHWRVYSSMTFRMRNAELEPGRYVFVDLIPNRYDEGTYAGFTMEGEE
jgi:hypothetical protein